MDNPYDVEIKFKTRGDDLQRLNEAISFIPMDEYEAVVSYLCYLKAEIAEQLDEAGFEVPPEELFTDSLDDLY